MVHFLSKRSFTASFSRFQTIHISKKMQNLPGGHRQLCGASLTALVLDRCAVSFCMTDRKKAKVRGGTFHLLVDQDTQPHHVQLCFWLEWNFIHLHLIQVNNSCSGETNRKGDVVSTNEPLGCTNVSSIWFFEIRPSRASAPSKEHLNQQMQLFFKASSHSDLVWPSLLAQMVIWFH